MMRRWDLDLGRSNVNLFLDDLRNKEDVTWVTLPDGEWIVVRSYNQFTNYVQVNGVPDVVSWDNDLGASALEDPNDRLPDEIFQELTGYDACKWLINYCIERQFQMPKCYVHSCNPIGKDNILGIISCFKRARPELSQNL